MKKVTIALCLLAGLHATAQKTSVEISGGGVWNTKPVNPLPYEKSSNIGGALSLKVFRDLPHNLQVGVSANYRRMSNRIEGDFRTEDQFDPLTGLPTGAPPVHKKFLSIIPVTGFGVLANKMFDIGKFRPFAGINAGYEIWAGENGTSGATENFGTGKITDGWSAGIQAGAYYKLAKHFNLSATLEEKYLGFPAFDGKGFYSTAFLAGIQYRF